jgi:hypothetical protein
VRHAAEPGYMDLPVRSSESLSAHACSPDDGSVMQKGTADLHSASDVVVIR